MKVVKKEVASVLQKEHLNLTTTGEAPLFYCSRGSDVTAILCYMAKYQHSLYSLKSDLSKFAFLLLFLAEEPEKAPKDTKKLPVLTKKHVRVTKVGEFPLAHRYNCGN